MIALRDLSTKSLIKRHQGNRLNSIEEGVMDIFGKGGYFQVYGYF